MFIFLIQPTTPRAERYEFKFSLRSYAIPSEANNLLKWVELLIFINASLSASHH